MDFFGEIDIGGVLTVLLRLVAACVLGGAIGLERERAGRSAGLRTHILICLGAALVMCTGEFIFTKYGANSGIDPARLGAQVVSGIGILCAGAILKDGSSIRGLTTATSLWCTSCIGLAAGSGNMLPALGGTVLVYLVLFVFRKLESRRRKSSRTVPVSIRAHGDSMVRRIEEWLRSEGCGIDALSFERSRDGDMVDISLEVSLGKNVDCARIAAGLSEISGVISAHCPAEEK